MTSQSVEFIGETKMNDIKAKIIHQKFCPIKCLQIILLIIIKNMLYISKVQH